jgi:hypothetical protein
LLAQKSLILFLAYRKASKSLDSIKRNTLERKFSYCLWDYIHLLHEEEDYSSFSRKHSKIIALIHSSASEAQDVGEKIKTRYLLEKICEEDSSELIRDICLWLRQFWKEPQHLNNSPPYKKYV